jgi:dipeptidyl aminopeptidase/acylaminoacyl peptidase
VSDEKKLMTADDLYRMINIEDPQISPDGQWVAYVRVTVDKMENTYHRAIWLSKTDGSAEPRPLTRGKNDMQPRWSPDGETLAFVSARGDKPQIYVLPLTALGGEARQLTSLSNGANSPSWSPDGKQIAFLAALNATEREEEDNEEEQDPPQDQLEAKHRKERKEDDEKQRSDPYRMWRIPYRQGTTFVDERHAQVYVIGLEDDAQPRRLTVLETGYQQPEWSLDGKSLYTARQFDPTADEPFVDQILCRLDVESGDETHIPVDDYSIYVPLPSPDGKWLAFGRLPKGKPGDLEAIFRLAVMPIDGGEVRDLNLSLDRGVNGFHWSSDSQSLVFTAPDSGHMWAYRVKIDGGEPQPLFDDDLYVTAFALGDDGAIAASVSTATNPATLRYWAPNADESITLADFNQEWLAEVTVQPTHEMWFKSPSGKDIQGWYILPPDYEEGKKYPLALNIHGGPRVMWSCHEPSMFHEWQFHAARGYVVFYCNPRGGDGYGEAFQRDLHGAWGEVAMKDIMAGVDTLLEKGFVDENRLAITGGSYGGYMTAWMVSHTDRFKSAVAQRGVYNLVSFYGTSDIPILISSDYSVEPWEDHEKLWYHSPLSHVHKIKTPLLIIHAENDYRVPIEQGEQLFAWVRRATETPVEMLRYPREGHELSRSGEPKHRVSRLTQMVEWFDRYTQV